MVALAVQYEEKGVAVITEGYKIMPNATGIHTGLLKLLCAPKGAKREKSQKIMKMWANFTFRYHCCRGNTVNCIHYLVTLLLL